MISPIIWEDPSFNKLSRDTRLLFIGMFSTADDEGYLRADEGSLKRNIFGFDENITENIKIWTQEIKKTMRSVHFYSVNRELYAHFVKWKEYQSLREDRIQPSFYPKCVKCRTSGGQMSGKRRADDGQVPAEVGKVRLGKGRGREVSTPPNDGGDAQHPPPPEEKYKPNPRGTIRISN